MPPLHHSIAPGLCTSAMYRQAAATCLDNLRQYRDITNREARRVTPCRISSVASKPGMAWQGAISSLSSAYVYIYIYFKPARLYDRLARWSACGEI